MVHRVRFTLAVLALASSSAVAGDIYRFRTADGRTILTDNPANAEPGAHLVDSSQYSAAGRLLRSRYSLSDARDRVREDVRYAESELMHAYSRLTAGVRAHEDELMPVVDDGRPPPRRGRRKIPRTPEYYARVEALTADVYEAQRRLDEARERYYALNPSAPEIASR